MEKFRLHTLKLSTGVAQHGCLTTTRNPWREKGLWLDDFGTKLTLSCLIEWSKTKHFLSNKRHIIELQEGKPQGWLAYVQTWRNDGRADFYIHWNEVFNRKSIVISLFFMCYNSMDLLAQSECAWLTSIHTCLYYATYMSETVTKCWSQKTWFY